ncbi:hypothetical protein HYH02_006023 [Chlamydomonas schloesseri]|uniref:Uncharacterized protein n=1 Tax=Chlamydomonas schloesseri TaxID=2026947 RepID=A0A835WKC4_9CHLO|nr:hypothetical protein HYH02_006023 [Chlamydomonas schloesseri]|eukprot:KAG2448666.1 hypothetical protein HYH02_006023 [Chlamydomonas schloesseri]
MRPGCFMDQLWVGVISSFVIMTAYWSIHETAVELDEPFGTVATWLIYDYAPKNVVKSIKNPTIYNLYTSVLAFMVVYRNNLAYGRYWEARTSLQTLISKLAVFMVEAANLELGGLKATATPEQRKESFKFLEELAHLTSLLYAVMMKQLRKDYNLTDMYDHETSHHVPYVDSKKVTSLWERLKALLVYAFSLNDFFPINTVHQEVSMPVIGGVREEERRYLEWSVAGEDMQTKGGDLNGARVMAVFAIINRKYLQRMNSGGLAGNTTFQSRVFSMATDCVGVFAQCAKLAATQFPFPWAQVLMVLLCILGITLPFVITSFMDQLWVGVISSFVIMTAYWSIHETAVELDEPFGTDPNDLPLARFVYELNQNMLATLKQLKAAYAEDDVPAAAVSANVSAAVSTSAGIGLKPVVTVKAAPGSPSTHSTPKAPLTDSARTPSYRQGKAGAADGGGGASKAAAPAALNWVSNDVYTRDPGAAANGGATMQLEQVVAATRTGDTGGGGARTEGGAPEDGSQAVATGGGGGSGDAGGGDAGGGGGGDAAGGM